MSKGRKILIKSAVSGILLSLLIYQMDGREFLRLISSAKLSLLFPALVLQAFSIVLSIFRWRIILDNFAIQVRFGTLGRLTLIGAFFNLFMPSAIGGDFFRAYYLSKWKGRGMSTTLTTILLERSSGLCALLAIGTLASAWNRMEVQGVDTLYFFLVLDALYVTVSVMVFHPRIHLRVKRFFDRFFWREMEAKLQLVADGLESLRKNVLSLLWTLALSLVIQFFSVVIIWIVGLSIGVQAPFPVFLMFIPLVNLTIMIPFTINGLGLRESAYYLLFAQIGVPVEMSVTLSLLNALLIGSAGIPGAVIYSLYKKEESFGEVVTEVEAN